MALSIQSFIRTGPDQFVAIAEAERWRGSSNHIEGAIVMTLDGVEVLGLDLWDDLNWLWRYVVKAAADARSTGAGETYFPDQPLLFRIEPIAWQDRVLVLVRSGDVNRAAPIIAAEFYPALATAALNAFAHLERIADSDPGFAAEQAVARSWL